MVSTPNAPDGLFERIAKESEETCIYKRLFLDYTYGIGKIYTADEIDKAKQSPSFDREYDLKYLDKIGNVFHTKDIETAIEKGMLYDPEITPAIPFAADFGISMGIDPGYGSSSFGIVITQLVDSQLQVLYANELQRPDFNNMLNVVMDLVNKHQVQKIYVDAANPSFIRALKMAIGDREDYENQNSILQKDEVELA
jgi:hypothetical protein